MLKFLIGIMFGYIFAWLLRYRQETKHAQKADPRQYDRQAYQDEIPERQSRIARLEAEREKLLGALDQCRSQTDTLEKQLTEKKAALNECAQRQKDLKDTLDAETAKTRRLENQLESLQASPPEPAQRTEPLPETKYPADTPSVDNGDAAIDLEALRQSLPEAISDPDDLRRIKGIGPVIEQTLNELGVTTFRQIALFSETQIDQVAGALKVFPDRMRRDDWMAQARELHTQKYGTSI